MTSRSSDDTMDQHTTVQTATTKSIKKTEPCATFVDLPNELLTQIFTSIECSEQNEMTLSLVNKRFKDIIGSPAYRLALGLRLFRVGMAIYLDQKVTPTVNQLHWFSKCSNEADQTVSILSDPDDAPATTQAISTAVYMLDFLTHLRSVGQKPQKIALVDIAVQSGHFTPYICMALKMTISRFREYLAKDADNLRESFMLNLLPTSLEQATDSLELATTSITLFSLVRGLEIALLSGELPAPFSFAVANETPKWMREQLNTSATFYSQMMTDNFVQAIGHEDDEGWMAPVEEILDFFDGHQWSVLSRDDLPTIPHSDHLLNAIEGKKDRRIPLLMTEKAPDLALEIYPNLFDLT